MKPYLMWIVILLVVLSNVVLADTQITYKEARIPMTEAGSEGLEALLVWPNDAESHPVALISHGTPRDASKRPEMTAISYLPIATEFARRGFATAVVLRRGYGTSGGGVADNIGQCASANYLPTALSASKDLHAAVDYLGTLPAFDINKILAVGISAGGLATIALTADQPPSGLVAAVSFAGGRGSKASHVLCNKNNLVKTFGILGKTSHLPMLWVYAENDQFFNPTLAKELYAAFTKNGGKATLIIAPPYGEEGHFLFSNDGIPVWTPIIDDFLQKQNLVLVDDLLPLPDTSNMVTPDNLSANGKKDFEKYIKAPPHKAFAMSSQGAYGWKMGQRTVSEAEEQAEANCHKYTDKKCIIIAVDDTMTQ